jgi:hypothetical protein
MPKASHGLDAEGIAENSRWLSAAKKTTGCEEPITL